MATGAPAYQAFLDVLKNPATIDSLAGEAYDEFFLSVFSAEAAVRRGHKLLGERLPYIGEQSGIPSGFDVDRGVHKTAEDLLSNADADARDAQFKVYVEVCMVTMRLTLLGEGGSGAAQVWSNAVENNASLNELDDNKLLDKFRQSLLEFVQTKRSRAPTSAGSGAGGGGGHGAPGGAAGGGTLHVPLLPELPGDLTPSQQYRALKSMALALGINKTFNALEQALKKRPDYMDAWKLYQAESTLPTEEAQVDEFLVQQMATLNPKLFTDEDRDEALAFRMDQGMDTTEYFRKLKRLLTTAKHSGTAAGQDAGSRSTKGSEISMI